MDNRELASLIVVAAFVVLAVAVSQKRFGLLKSFLGVVRGTFHPRLLGLWVAYLLYAAAVMWGAYRLGVWTPDLVTSTVLVVVFTGLPLVGSSISDKGDHIVRPVLKKTFGVAAILSAYVYLESFALGWEIFWQAILAMLSMAAVLGDARVVKLFNRIALIYALASVVHTTTTLVGGADQVEWLALAQAVALPFWYPVALIPLLYVVGYYSAVELAACRVQVSRRRLTKWRWGAILAVGLRLRVSYARRFVAPWVFELADASSRHERRSVLADFRRTHSRSVNR
ncbi:hypothetical protein [Isoptericola sediminis]|uniref:Uncharacterized protein n=1 Tax=Isoptericola sediminis TaxID=2733572 RepID=A0A849KIH5_9MICO|nr:hypothetical protein [Isoptericola sediminis]NNU28453.1 hypothetical protein [Isoptericola sediminis]